jgi:hypothetical protein
MKRISSQFKLPEENQQDFILQQRDAPPEQQKILIFGCVVTLLREEREIKNNPPGDSVDGYLNWDL